MIETLVLPELIPQPPTEYPPLSPSWLTVAVLMADKEEKRCGLIIDGQVRTSCGVVIAKGPYVPLNLGQVVLVRPSKGHHLIHARFGEWFADTIRGEVRWYGSASVHEHYPCYEGYNKGIVGTMTEDKKVVALGEWLFIKRDPLFRSSSGIILPDANINREMTATVLSGGGTIVAQDGTSRKNIFSEGDRICYNPRGLVVDVDVPSGYDISDGSDYAFIRECDVHAKIVE